MIKIDKLSNGIPVVMEHVNNVKSAAIGIYVKTGAKYENEREHGISHFLEHMFFKGTKTRSAKKISEEIDDFGGHINAFTSKEITSYYVSILSDYLHVGIEVLADMYLNSVFEEEEVEKERRVIIEEIRMYEDIPEEKVHDLNTEFALKGSGVANNVLGTEDGLKKIFSKDIKNYWSERYTTNNTVIAVAGKIEFEKVMAELERSFSSHKSKLKEREYNKNFILRSGENLVKEDTNQVHLCVNTKTSSYIDKDKYAYSIIANVLGGGMSSRLFQKIREERGLAYSVYAYNSTYEEGGLMTIYAGTTKENYREVIDIIKNEFEIIKNQNVTKEEFYRIKNQLKSGLVLGTETSKSRMSRIGASYTNYGVIKSLDEIEKDIEKITMEDIKRCSENIFVDRDYSSTVLGDI